MNFNFKDKLVNGDSLKELKKIPDETFDLIFADPPYNLQLKKELTRPDMSKVCAVNDFCHPQKDFYFLSTYIKTILSYLKKDKEE